MKISTIWDEFIEYKLLEEGRSKGTITKYNDCKNKFIQTEGDLDVEALTKFHFNDLKSQLQHLSPARVSNIIFCMRALLKFCREEKEMETIDPAKIKIPKQVRKEIIYLNNKEVQDFLEAVDIESMTGLRMRTLCEVLLDTGARINEALSLNRDSIKEEEGITFAKIIGKGNKERKLFFSGRAMYWIERYLSARDDKHPALFVTHNLLYPTARLKKNVGTRSFKKIAKEVGIDKRVSSHIMRHTFCTNLLKNGTGLAFIQRLAGHADISTTLRFYARLDDIDLVKAKTKLNYELSTGFLQKI